MPDHTLFDAHFSRLIPDALSAGVLYISMDYGTVIHLCACGCGEKVITPLSPTDWQLLYDGETVTLMPSIGNYNFPCRSHYWIKNSQVVWAPSFDTPGAHMSGPEVRLVDPAPTNGLAKLRGYFRSIWRWIVQRLTRHG